MVIVVEGMVMSTGGIQKAVELIEKAIAPLIF
jgi:hypothetical protein